MPYARSMGAHSIPIVRGIAVSMRRTVLRREPLQGKMHSSAQRIPGNRNALREHDNSYVQLSVKIAKLEKSNKKLKRVNKKCKHDRDSDSDRDDSDSS